MRIQSWKFPCSLVQCGPEYVGAGVVYPAARCHTPLLVYWKPQLPCEVELKWIQLNRSDRFKPKVFLFLCFCSTELLKRTSSVAAGNRTSGMSCTTLPVRLTYIYNTYVPHWHDIAKREWLLSLQISTRFWTCLRALCRPVKFFHTKLGKPFL